MFRSRDTLKNILYIEDDAGLARLLQKRMSRLGYEVDIAESGEQGLELFRENTYDAVLVDYYLPGMFGIDVIRSVAPHELSPPFILLTAAGDEKIALEALTVGAADYLVKDPNQVYLDLLPAVISAAFARVQLARENQEQQAQLFHYAEQLRISEERLHLAMEGSETGVWDWDLNTNILYWSANLRRDFGLPDGTPPTFEMWMARIHPDDREAMDSAIREHLNGETALFNILYRELPPDGQNDRPKWILVRGVALSETEGGRPCRMVGTRTDFTEFKAMEEQLEIAKNKAEAASQAKSEFLAMMSHEIRTPMNAVMGLAAILAQTPLSDKQKEIVQTLKTSADALLYLINDLLDISRIEAKQVSLEHTPFDLSQLLKEITDTARVQAAAKNLALTLDCGELAGITFLGDPLRMRQIAVNLISNAIKFTDAGEVAVSLRGQSDAGDQLHALTLTVRDTGIGIPLEKREMIFDKFVQADQSITRRFGGSGLGLSISRSLAKLMGGEITVESEPGKGSTFTLALKLKKLASRKVPDTPDAASLPGLGSAPTGKPVLLVEDYPANVVVAGLMLESLGYRYDVATNGQQALERVKTAAEPYAAILMDVQMQGIDGYETTRQIRAHERDTGQARHFILGVTAHAMAGDREQCLNAGMDEYITKPINPDELGSKLREGIQ